MRKHKNKYTIINNVKNSVNKQFNLEFLINVNVGKLYSMKYTQFTGFYVTVHNNIMAERVV